ncbi:MAG TPA: hypothetical protein PL009_14620 [Flavipsychrobacter sp.]|mgnify:CR=1 FL=1|nr:hypothetical protein [Flavipsychrobacter sp.]
MAIKIITPNSSNPTDLQHLVKQGMSDNDIEFLLMENYKDEFLVRNLMMEVKKLRNSHKTALGLMLVLGGAFIMLLGFVFAFFSTSSGLMLNVFLYGFTVVGLLVAFGGLVKIFN